MGGGGDCSSEDGLNADRGYYILTQNRHSLSDFTRGIEGVIIGMNPLSFVPDNSRGNNEEKI